MTLEELSEEQWKMLNAPLKQKDSTPIKGLTEFDFKPDNIPPCVFPKKQYVQTKVTE